MTVPSGGIDIDDDDDDLYVGYNNDDGQNDYANTSDMAFDEGLRTAIATRYGSRAGAGFTQSIPGTAVLPGKAQGGRLMTGRVGNNQQTDVRPMTSVRAAGYTSLGSRRDNSSTYFDPANLGGRGPAPPLEGKDSDSPEEATKELEKRVNQLIEESAIANVNGDLQKALDKAKEAGKKERQLCKQRDVAGLGEQINLDLTHSVLFNLANQYHSNRLYSEAISTYSVIVKNKLFNNAGRLRVNMGNIAFEQGKFTQAIKMYRMALDQIPNTHRDMRFRIMQNIGCAFVKMGHYQEAIASFETIMDGRPMVDTGFNLLLGYFALGDRERMREGFERLLSVPSVGLDDDASFYHADDEVDASLLRDLTRHDELYKMDKEKHRNQQRCITTAAKLIAPVIERDFAAGFDWCIEAVKESTHADLAAELEITKAITYLRMKDFRKAVDTLKAFEKKDTQMASAAAVNLSFLYHLEGEFSQAAKYADLAVHADRYNSNALVNKGNCAFRRNDFETAKELYEDALKCEASCTEALYNLGLVHKQKGSLQEALQCFRKLHAMLRNSAEVIWQVAILYDALDDTERATEWFNILVSLVPTDPTVLAKMGEVYDRMNEKSQAYQYHYEAYRYFPSNLDVISWLGAYYVDCEVYEQACQYFERASLIQSGEVKWYLMAASCHRRSGNYQQALDMYKRIHLKFPDNVDCLRFLVRICTDLGMKELHEYVAKLRKAEKLAEMTQVQQAQRNNADSDNDDDSDGDGRLRGPDRNERREGSGRGEHSHLTDPYGDTPNLPKSVDTSYADPVGQMPGRPKTASRNRAKDDEDDWANEEIGDDLLPE